MPITSVKGRWILDSRAKPTVEVELSDGKLTVRGVAPSGASTGKKEAVELRDGGKAFHGFGVSRAVENVNNLIAPALIGREPHQREVDELLIKLDGTSNKERLGANATIATSMAVAKLSAAENEQPLYAYISDITSSKASLPKPMFNVVNGGEHAGNGLAVQEFLIVPELRRFSESYRAASEIYWALKEIIKARYGRNAINVGDEGGFAPPLEKTSDALSLLSAAISKAGYEGEVRISLDAAANSFYREGLYFIDGMQLSREELIDFWVELAKTYNLLSIEDPFAEEDVEGFSILKAKGCCKIIGDDLTVTNVERLKAVASYVNGLIIKPNQIGTLTETFETVNYAKEHTPFIITSHRSGETEDTFIAHMAVGIGSPYAKFGAPARGERTCKYNELLRIEELLEG